MNNDEQAGPIDRVLLVHGAWHGPWCWEAHWSPHLESAGFDVEAIALPAHDRPGDRGRIWPSMASYVEVVREAVGDRGDQTILIGHSMGGLVVQRAMEKVDVAGAVLVASVPRWGVGPGAVRMVRREPWTSIKATVMLDMWSFVKDEELTRQAFFRPETPQEIVSSTFDQLQNESYLAYVSMMVRPPRPGRVSTSVLVLAAEDDGIFTVEEEKQLAKAYDGDFQLIEGSGHDVMLDTRWEEAADEVLTWIKALDGSGS